MKAILSSRRHHYLKRLGTFLVAVALIVEMVACAAYEEQPEWTFIVDFEDLTVGTEYHVGDTFTSCGVGIHVDEFQWSPPNKYTDAGYARVQAEWDAHGAGQEILVNNASLYFRFNSGLPETLWLLFGEYGSRINIGINGDFENVHDFEDLPSSMGGVDVSFRDYGGGNGTGHLILSNGKISTFTIGGEELAIDHVRLAIPS